MLANLLLKMRGLLNHSLSSESDGLAWVLGCPYNLPYEYSELLDDVRSRIWVSYRSGYFPIRDHNGGCYTSDQGWGCMLRCGQMILAQTFLTRELGRDWRWQRSSDEDLPDAENTTNIYAGRPSDALDQKASDTISPQTPSNASLPPHIYKGNPAPQAATSTVSVHTKTQNERYRQVISCFRDAPTSPYSIHAIAYEGVALDKHIGQWFGPTTVAQALRRLCENEQLKALHAHGHEAEEEPLSRPIPLQHTTSIGSDSLGIAIGGVEEGLTIATYIAMDGVVGKDDMDMAIYTYIERKQTAHAATIAYRRARNMKQKAQEDNKTQSTGECRNRTTPAQPARGKSREVGGSMGQKNNTEASEESCEVCSGGDSGGVRSSSTDDWDGLDVTETDIQSIGIHNHARVAPDKKTTKPSKKYEQIQYVMKPPAEGGSKSRNRQGRPEIGDRFRDDIDGEAGYVLAEGVRTPEADRDAGLVEGGLVPGESVGKDYDVISLDKSTSVSSRSVQSGSRSGHGTSVDARDEGDKDRGTEGGVDSPAPETENTARTHEEEQEELDNTPLLLMIPLRLGLDYINSCYIPQLKKVLMMPSSTGFIGGKPNSAYYFIGYKGSDVIFIDPHLTQPTVATQPNGRINTESYHCSQVNVLPFSSMDPSLCLGFLLNTKAERDEFITTFELKQRLETPPLFSVVQTANPFSQTSKEDTGDVVSGSGSNEDSNSDDFEII